MTSIEGRRAASDAAYLKRLKEKGLRLNGKGVIAIKKFAGKRFLSTINEVECCLGSD